MSKIFGLFLVLALVACGKPKSEDVIPAFQNPKRVDWAAVPAEFNPQIQDVNFTIENTERINISVMGFQDDFEITYVSNLVANSAVLKIYKVQKDGGFSESTTINKSNAKTVDLNTFGNSNCTIKIANGKITALKGGCYVRLQLVLPLNAQIEVYNVGNLVSARFFPMTNEDFLKNFDRATWAADKFREIENFMTSYDALRKRAHIPAETLKTVLKGFIRSEDKLKALSRLHGAVYDRENLPAVIDDQFMFRERDEARRIVGL